MTVRLCTRCAEGYGSKAQRLALREKKDLCAACGTVCFAAAYDVGTPPTPPRKGRR